MSTEVCACGHAKSNHAADQGKCQGTPMRFCDCKWFCDMGVPVADDGEGQSVQADPCAATDRALAVADELAKVVSAYGHAPRIAKALIDFHEAESGPRQTDGYGRCLPPCRCADCGRPRKLAQGLPEAIGSVGPEKAEDTVARAARELMDMDAPRSLIRELREENHRLKKQLESADD